jgi:hypothetical protein
VRRGVHGFCRFCIVGQPTVAKGRIYTVKTIRPTVCHNDTECRQTSNRCANGWRVNDPFRGRGGQEVGWEKGERRRGREEGRLC